MAAAAAHIAPQLVGTAQHPSAQDLSSYLIHMTRTPEDLASILVTGRLEARSSFGLAGKRPEHAGTHRSVCLTETPASELGRFADKRPYGLVFTREFIRSQGGQPVWYVRYGSPAFDALLNEINRPRAGDGASRFFELTPFIDMSKKDGYEFEWEREWRVNGDIVFGWDDVAFLITPDQGLLTVQSRPTIGTGHYHPDHQDYIWTGGDFPALDEAVGALAEQFSERFAEPGNELVFSPDEPGGLAWGPHQPWSTQAAAEYLWTGRPQAVLDALVAHLEQRTAYWVER